MDIPSYEDITFAGPDVWLYLFKYFSKCRMCSFIKSGQVLPLFKGKGTKANDKDNNTGITIFPTLCKVCELILFQRLDALQIISFLIFSLASKRVVVVLRPHSPFWKLLIMVLNVEAKFLLVFSRHP